MMFVTKIVLQSDKLRNGIQERHVGRYRTCIENVKCRSRAPVQLVCLKGVSRTVTILVSDLQLSKVQKKNFDVKISKVDGP